MSLGDPDTENGGTVTGDHPIPSAPAVTAAVDDETVTHVQDVLSSEVRTVAQRSYAVVTIC
jgi:hypothetical protein